MLRRVNSAARAAPLGLVLGLAFVLMVVTTVRPLPNCPDPGRW